MLTHVFRAVFLTCCLKSCPLYRCFFKKIQQHVPVNSHRPFSSALRWFWMLSLSQSLQLGLLGVELTRENEIKQFTKLGWPDWLLWQQIRNIMLPQTKQIWTWLKFTSSFSYHNSSWFVFMYLSLYIHFSYYFLFSVFSIYGAFMSTSSDLRSLGNSVIECKF